MAEFTTVENNKEFGNVVMTRAQQEASKAERYYMLDVLRTNEAAAEVLDNNYVSDITSLINRNL